MHTQKYDKTASTQNVMQRITACLPATFARKAAKKLIMENATTTICSKYCTQNQASSKAKKSFKQIPKFNEEIVENSKNINKTIKYARKYGKIDSIII